MPDVPNTTETCPFCGGSGGTTAVDAIDEGRLVNPRPAVCMVCNGSGTVKAEAPTVSETTDDEASAPQNDREFQVWEHGRRQGTREGMRHLSPDEQRAMAGALRRSVRIVEPAPQTTGGCIA